MSRREFVSDLRDHEGITPGHAAFFFVLDWRIRFAVSCAQLTLARSLDLATSLTPRRRRKLENVECSQDGSF
jgi:hypothetical protein